MATFTESVTIGGTNSYAWNSPANWVGRSLPSNDSNIVLNTTHLGGVSYDNLTLTNVVGIAFSHSATHPLLEIASGTTLDITGSLGLANSGTIDVNGGAVLTTTTFVNTGIIGLDGINAVVELPDFKNSGTIAYDSKHASVFLSTPLLSAVYSNDVTGFDVDDKIYLHGTSFTSAAFTHYAAVVTEDGLDVDGIQSNGTVIDLYNLTNFGTAADLTSINAFVTQTTDPSSGTIERFLELDGVCFAGGTRIAVETGERAVEDLRPGDRVVTVATGQHVLRCIKWIGERSIDLSFHPRPESLYPIRIRRGAFAEDLPRRDLLVSPNHCLFVDAQLVPAKLLVNGTTIAQDRSVRTVHYYHVELDCHEVLLAEGLPTESYLDTENRAFFANADEPTILHPDLDPDGLAAWQERLCAPLRLRSVEVDPIWQHLAARGELLGHVVPAVVTTMDSDLRLLAGERTLYPVVHDHNRCAFVVPSGSGDVRIVSRSVVPVELDRHADDWRRLGVSVRKIVLRRGHEQIEIPPDHPALVQGWHPAETDVATTWRWTDGNAFVTLPPMWRAGALTIELHLGCSIAYAAGDESTLRRVA